MMSAEQLLRAAHRIGAANTARAAKPLVRRAAAAPKRPKATTPAPKRRAAVPVSFTHLREAAEQRTASAEARHAQLEQWCGAPLVSDPATTAARIRKAAARARKPTSGPKPTGVAAHIIAAGKKRRGEI